MPAGESKNNIYINDLYSAILKLRNLDEAQRFFRDLLTEQEILEFSRRWRAAQMLASRQSYAAIEQETGLSSTTVARISKWLNSGMDGYKLIIKRTRAHQHHLTVRKGLA